MGYFEDLVKDFFDKYEEPKIEPLTVGFSDIDPPLKQIEPNKDHELLENLLGGDENGHYHLTKELYDKVIELLDKKDLDGGFDYTADEEYEVNKELWFDGGFADTSDDDYLDNEDNWADGGDVDSW